MPNNLYQLNESGCPTVFPNGLPGQVLAMVNGSPTWVNPSGGGGGGGGDGWTTLASNGQNSFVATYPNGQTFTFTVTSSSGPITSFVNNNNGTATFTNEAGVQTTIPIGWPTFVNNGNNSFTVTYPNGTTFTFSVAGSGGETVTTLTNSGGGTITFTNETGVPVVLDICDIIAASCNAALIFNANGTWTHTANSGTQTVFGPFIATIADNGNDSYTATSTNGAQLTWSVAMDLTGIQAQIDQVLSNQSNMQLQLNNLQSMLNSITAQLGVIEDCACGTVTPNQADLSIVITDI